MLQNNEKTAEVLKAERIVEQAKARLAEAKRKAVKRELCVEYRVFLPTLWYNGK